MEFTLARIYFVIAITFHIIFPTINIGLAWIISLLEGLYLKTGKEKYLDSAKFWTKIFAMLFGVGVVTGITMSFMFGLTFSKLMDTGGNILGPLLSFEVLSAFFIEASFLGVMLFGWNKVGKKYHFASSLMVAIGATTSAFWILSANSFMQTPDGYALENGILIAKDWQKIIFNPSFPYRFFHMINASIMTASMFVLGISIFKIKKNESLEKFNLTANISSLILIVSGLLQIVLGDMHGLNTLKYQPAKIAALEGHWENEIHQDGSKGQPIVLFGIPNEKEQKNDFEISIPKLGSIILTHTLDGEIPALKDFPTDQRPPVKMPFFCFRIMVGSGFLMLFIALWFQVAIRKSWIGWKNSSKSWICNMFNKIMINLAIASIPLGVVATIAGWYVTEIGRQPWVVYGVLRSKDAITPNLEIASVIFGICFTSIIYLGLGLILVKYTVMTIKKEK